MRLTMKIILTALALISLLCVTPDLQAATSGRNVAGLGFASSPQTLVDAKLSIQLASLIAGLLGYRWLRFAGTRT